MENQLEEERKIRLKQESRIFAAASTTRSSRPSPFSRQALVKFKPEKPPLGTSKLRMPLRRITNFMPQAFPLPPLPPRKTATAKSVDSSSTQDKENARGITSMAANRESLLMKPRRCSVVAVRSSGPTKISWLLQPKRRVSIAALQPGRSSYMATPLNNSNGSTIGRPPLISRVLQPKRRVSAAMVQRDTSSYMANRRNNSYGSAIGRPSLLKEPRKVRYSNFFPPLPREGSSDIFRGKWRV